MVALRWKKDELLALLEAAPELRQRMEHVALEAIMRRLLRDTDGAHVKDYLKVIRQSWADADARKHKEMEHASSDAPPTLALLLRALGRSRGG